MHPTSVHHIHSFCTL